MPAPRSGRPALPATLAILLATFCASVVMAAVAEQPVRRFDDLVQRIKGGVIATAPRALDSLDPRDELRLAWEKFQRDNSGNWTVYLDERTAMPTLVSGSGIVWFSAETLGDLTLDDIETRARAFLSDHEDLFGDWKAILLLDADASGEIRPGRWQVLFRQAPHGVAVENSRLEFHVDRGRLTMFGATNWGAPTRTGLPSITAADAGDFLDAYLGVATAEIEAVGEPELTVVALDAAPALDRPRRWSGARGAGLAHALIWRISFREPGDPTLWVAEIDAHTGSVRAFYDGTHYAGVRGGVYRESPNLGCTTGDCEIDGFPMPFADILESGQAAAVSDEYGNLACVDPGATFETTLRGPYVAIDDDCGEISETAGCSEALQLGVKAGENCEVAFGSSPGNTAAARSAYYHVNRVAEVARFYNPENSWLNGTPVTIHTNWNQTCNASYGSDTIYVYRSGTSWAECANTGEIQGITTHEWGHGLDENDGGSWDNTSEAYADIVAMLASRQSCFGPGMFTGGRVCSGYGDTCLTCTGFRDWDWAARVGNTPATPQVFVQGNCEIGTGDGPCGGEIHCEALPIDEAVYDLATRDLPAAGMDIDSAWQLVERLWYTSRTGSGGDIYTCALPLSDSCAASNWYQRMRVADDDDGDLSNGTPHAAELYAAFARHNIACGLPGDAENQNTTSCPALVTPVLMVAETVSGTELDWDEVPGAAGYLVYRGDLGCGMQQVPAATLPAGVTAFVDGVSDTGLQRNYRVEAIGANPVCRSAVSNCETTPVGPRLQKSGHRMIEDGANVNGNGKLDPGETVKLPVTLFNGGTEDALGVYGRLRTVDPAQGRVVEPFAAYPDIFSGFELESNDPHFGLTLFNSGFSCGDVVELELEMVAAGAAPRASRFLYPVGSLDQNFFKDANVTIPRQTPTPVTSTQDVAEDRTIIELDVSVSIPHPNAAELIVELSSPMGTTVRLHDNTGSGSLITRYDLDTVPDGPGSMADFDGESIQGTWTLSVSDTIWGAIGAASIQDWTLHVTAEGGFGCEVLNCAEPVPPAGPASLHVDKTLDGGDGSVDLIFDWSSVSGVAGYHVLHSTSPLFDTPVDLTGRTAGPTTLTVENGAAITPPLSFFQVRSANGCNEESP